MQISCQVCLSAWFQYPFLIRFLIIINLIHIISCDDLSTRKTVLVFQCPLFHAECFFTLSPLWFPERPSRRRPGHEIGGHSYQNGQDTIRRSSNDPYELSPRAEGNTWVRYQITSGVERVLFPIMSGGQSCARPTRSRNSTIRTLDTLYQSYPTIFGGWTALPASRSSTTP